MAHGIAGPIRTLLDKQFFVINYSGEWKIPHWVAYHLSDSALQGDTRRTNDFRVDSELPLEIRSKLSDYRGSGYDRGHNAPAAAFKRSRDAMSTTFFLSNISPQTPSLNRRIWRILEEQVREVTQREGQAWIVTGNTFMSVDSQLIEPILFIGLDSVAVPTHCFKAILTFNEDGGFAAYGFLIPNETSRISGVPRDYQIAVDRLEEVTGIDFFPLLEDDIEEQIERIRLEEYWP